MQHPVAQQPQAETTDESIHTLSFEHPINAISFQNTGDNNVKFAVGSYNIDRPQNSVEVY